MTITSERPHTFESQTTPPRSPSRRQHTHQHARLRTLLALARTLVTLQQLPAVTQVEWETPLKIENPRPVDVNRPLTRKVLIREQLNRQHRPEPTVIVDGPAPLRSELTCRRRGGGAEVVATLSDRNTPPASCSTRCDTEDPAGRAPARRPPDHRSTQPARERPRPTPPPSSPQPVKPSEKPPRPSAAATPESQRRFETTPDPFLYPLSLPRPLSLPTPPFSPHHDPVNRPPGDPAFIVSFPSSFSVLIVLVQFVGLVGRCVGLAR